MIYKLFPVEKLMDFYTKVNSLKLVVPFRTASKRSLKLPVWVNV